MEKQNWEENEFQKQIRITEESLRYIKKIRGKTSSARKLDEIIDFYKKNGKVKNRPKQIQE
mgnify:CR=1 FL=1